MSSDEIGNLPPIDSGTPSAPDEPVWTTVRDVLPAAGDPTAEAADLPRQSRGSRVRRGALAGGAAVLVLGLVGGVTYAAGSLTGGGGAQPATALPSGAFGLVSVDLDPSAGQKLDGFRFMRKFPTLKSKVPLDGDVREIVFDALSEQAGWGDVDYGKDVAPWLGKRMGLAAYAPTGAAGSTDLAAETPTWVLALQVTDDAAAKDGLARLTRDGRADDAVGYVVAGDYALLAASTQVAQQMADRAERGTLAADTAFAADMDAAADGIAVAWVDMAGAGKALGTNSLGLGGSSAAMGLASGASGRSTLVARFDGPDVFEVVGRATGADTAGWSTHPVRGLGELPASTALALGVSDGSRLVPLAYESMKKSFGAKDVDLDDLASTFEQEYGIRFPADLALLFGDNLVLALDGTKGDQIALGARITTDAAAATKVLDKVQTAVASQGADFPLVRRTVGKDLVIASSKAQAGRLAERGTLGDVSSFSKALPGLADADVAIWADPVAVVRSFGEDSTDKDLAAVAGIGVTMTSRAAGEKGVAAYRFRLVAH